MFSFFSIIAVVTNLQVAQPVIVTKENLLIEFTPRPPNGMASFYEARGFPKPMIDILKQQCFITVGITNKSNKKIWMDLTNWTFTSAGKPIKREHRDYWKNRWQEMGIPLSNQSTFRWTLIPETLDYLPGEREGGNIILPFTKEPISVHATFTTGEKKQEETITITTDKLYCAEDTQ